jgi:putative transposase
MKHAFIDSERNQHSIRNMCNALRISESGYYASRNREPSERSHRHEYLSTEIGRIHEESRQTYGAPRIHAELQSQGENCCKNTVARLMRQSGVVPKTIRRFKVTTDSRYTTASPNLLNRNFHTGTPNYCWLTDVTFIPTREGWLYLAALLDLHSRAIIGWSMSDRMNGNLVMDALHMALERRHTAPKIHHSDRGSLYAMARYRALLDELGIRQSMSKKGDCWDNAPMESFFHSLKTELVMHCDYKTREEARASVFEYIEVFYNRQRRHSTIGYVCPAEFEKANQPLIKASTERG